MYTKQLGILFGIFFTKLFGNISKIRTKYFPFRSNFHIHYYFNKIFFVKFHSHIFHFFICLLINIYVNYFFSIFCFSSKLNIFLNYIVISNQIFVLIFAINCSIFITLVVMNFSTIF